jgi:hypothetical protein
MIEIVIPKWRRGERRQELISFVLRETDLAGGLAGLGSVGLGIAP